MNNKGINYPHPVLNEYTDDYLDSAFSLEILSNSDNGSELVIEVQTNLKSSGLLDLITQGKAEVILRVMCHRTSYRYSVQIKANDKTLITISKNKLADRFSMQAMVVAKQDLNGMSLPEFNQKYFRGVSFTLRKGDILADEPGVWVKLDTLFEPNVGGIVYVKNGGPNDPIKVTFAEESDENPSTCDYIYVTLPEQLYKAYHNLKNKKYLKTGIERFLQCSIILPALVEGISRLRYEETVDSEGEGPHYRHTIWGESIYAGLEKRGITTLDDELRSDYVLANMLLGDVISDSISNLMTKTSELAKAQWEELN